MVHTGNQLTGLSRSTARKPGFGAEKYLYGVQISENACRKIFPRASGGCRGPRSRSFPGPAAMGIGNQESDGNERSKRTVEILQ
jgi:hypothetical protein